MRRSTHALRSIDKFIVDLGRAAGSGDVIPVVLGHLRREFQIDYARILSNDGGSMRSWSLDDGAPVAGLMDDSDRPVVEAAVTADGAPVAVRTAQDHAVLAAARREGCEIHALLVGRARREFDDRERAQFRSVFAHAAVALQNMRLLNRLQEKAHALEHLANHDPLTGLANRMRFNEVASESLERGEVAGVLLIDLDRFKEVNDTLGHHVGDDLLREIAYRLRFSIGRSGLIGRLGGDEFVVLLHPDRRSPESRARRLHTDLERPADLGEVQVDVGASIGLAIPHGGEDVGELLRRADVAMYSAKSRHSGVEVFSTDLDHYRPESLALVPRFRSAIEHGDLTVAFQPQFELATDTVMGAEALVRWSLSGVGPIPPSDFIPIAESTGLIRPLTRFVLIEAIEQCAQWRDAGHPLRVSVNIAPRVLLDPGLPDQVSNLLHTVGLPPSSLRLEVTETTIMTDPDRSIAVLRDLTGRGMSIAVDDFGTGHSSLAYLATLPCHELKIDKSFIAAVDEDPRSRAVVAAIVRLGHDLGLDVIAEGVETSHVAEQVSRLGCRRIQGYRYGRPMTGREFARFLAERQRCGDRAAEPVH